MRKLGGGGAPPGHLEQLYAREARDRGANTHASTLELVKAYKRWGAGLGEGRLQAGVTGVSPRLCYLAGAYKTWGGSLGCRLLGGPGVSHH